jgi:outer membrane protein assembly factor BamB
MHRRGLLALTTAPFLILGAAPAADWPQWRGPDRSDVSAETGLLKSWPQGGPRPAWAFDQAGFGYSGPAVVGDRLYCAGSDEPEDKEFVFCVDVTTGGQLWRTPLVRRSNATRISPDRGGGPRSTPTVDGDAVYFLGCKGDLVCLDAATGKLRWQKNMVTDFGGKVMSGWGWCESPLVDGDKLVCCPGYENGTVVALNKATGEVLWRSKDLTDSASYASPVVATIAGARQYVLMTDKHVAGLSAADGKLLWQETVGVNGTANIPTPLVRGDYVFATCGYLPRGSCGLVKLTAAGAGVRSEVVYKNTNLANHHGGVVLVGDHVFGYAEPDRGRDVRGGWTCLEFLTGKVVWSSDKLGKGSLTAADGKLYCYAESNGAVALVDASPAGWAEHGRFTVPKKSARRAGGAAIRTHPVVANGKLYLRDQELLFCYDVRAGGRAAE